MKNRKLVSSLILLLFIPYSCENEDPVISVISVSLSESNLIITEGGVEKLNVIIKPEMATNKNVVWKSGDTSVVSVTQEGKITAHRAGNATITVTTEEGGKTAVCDVTVTHSRLSLSQTDYHISGAGGTISIDVAASDDWSIISKPYWVSVAPSSGVGNVIGADRIEISVKEYSDTPVYRTGEIIFELNGIGRTASFKIEQYNFPYEDGDYVKVQSSTFGDGIDLVFLGDGYTIEDIGTGKFSENLIDAVDYFFDIEPYRTYRNYFDVYIVYAFSEDSGISDNNITRNTKFLSKYENSDTPKMSTSTDKCFEYARKVPLSSDLTETLITVVTNSSRYGGTTWLVSDGRAISIVAVSDNPYPHDFRSIVQHEAGGHGFGKLADEYVSYDTKISEYEMYRLTSWQQHYNHYKNVDITNNLNEIEWSHFINDHSYSYVGAHEGGFLYLYGVWRPEPTSLMVNNVSYINAPGRELIVKRIKKLSGEMFSFEEFKDKDVRETYSLTRSAHTLIEEDMLLPPPVLIEAD